jgi:hypothetical protein
MSTVKKLFLGVDKSPLMRYTVPAYEKQRHKEWFALLQYKAE